MTNCVSFSFCGFDFFIHSVPVCQDWMSGEGGGNHWNSFITDPECAWLHSPSFPRVNVALLQTAAFSACVVVVFFFPIIGFYSSHLGSFFWCWEIHSLEAFPILVNTFGSIRHQSVIQTNSTMHTLIFLIYPWLMLALSSQPVSKLKHFFCPSLTRANSSFYVEGKMCFPPAFQMHSVAIQGQVWKLADNCAHRTQGWAGRSLFPRATWVVQCWVGWLFVSEANTMQMKKWVWLCLVSTPII